MCVCVCEQTSALCNVTRARVVQTYGQRVRAYYVEAMPVGGSSWTVVANATSIGNKHIDTFDPVDVTALRLTVIAAIAQPMILDFAAFAPCPW